MLYIPEAVAVVRQPYSVITCDEFNFTAGDAFPAEYVVVHGQVSVLRVIDFGVTEKRRWIKDAKADLDDNQRENQRAEQKRDILSYRFEVL
jgi:hypothetical protein